MNRIRTNMFCNPFYIYIYSFLFVFVTYAFDWSNLYPTLTFSVYLFFIASFIIAGMFGVLFQRKNMPRFIPVKSSPRVVMYYFLAGIFLVLMDIAYSGKIPLFEFAEGAQYGELEYGIPTLHVFIVAYNSFLATYIFYCYLNDKRKVYLLYYFILCLCPLLVLSRSNLLFILISSLFVYLSFKGRKVYGILIKLVILVILILFGFGYLGNIRSSHETESYADPNEFIMAVGDAKESFRNSAVPKAYFWAYIYISSPLANLQETIDNPVDKYSFRDGVGLVVQRQFIWDFLSKRIEDVTGLKKGYFKQISPVLTVATTFAEPFTYLHWTGMIMMYLYMMGLIFIYLVLLPGKSRFSVVGVAILNTIVLLGIFDNMLVYTPLSIQLIFPFIFSLRLVGRKQDKEKYTNNINTDSAEDAI